MASLGSTSLDTTIGLSTIAAAGTTSSRVEELSPTILMISSGSTAFETTAVLSTTAALETTGSAVVESPSPPPPQPSINELIINSKVMLVSLMIFSLLFKYVVGNTLFNSKPI